MSGHVKINGPLHFPSQAGKLLKRSRFLDSTQRVYWGPRRHITFRSPPQYQDPTFWPPVDAPVLMPHVLRWRGGVIQGTIDLINAIKAAGTSLEATYKNLYSDVSNTLPLSAQSNALAAGEVLDADIASEDFLTTDVLLIILPFSIDGPVPDFTQENNSLARILTAIPFFPRYHIRAYLLVNPNHVFTDRSAIFNAYYGGTVPGVLGNVNYSYGGIIFNNASPPASTFISFVESHWNLTP